MLWYSRLFKYLQTRDFGQFIYRRMSMGGGGGGCYLRDQEKTTTKTRYSSMAN